MKKYLKPVLSICLTLSVLTICISHARSAPAEQVDLDEIIDRIDKLFRSNTSISSMVMDIETPNWRRSLSMKVWTEGLDKTYVYIFTPKKESGTATLRVDNEMWNFFPKINKVMKVPPSMMMSSWMGSDFTNDDLVKESSLKNDYIGSLIYPDDADDGYYYVQLVPKEDSAIVWGKIIAKVRKDDYIPVRQDYYDERGKHMRVMELKDIKPMGGRTIPAVMVLTPLNKKGNKTTVTYTEAVFDKPLKKGVFTLRNLQKRR